MPLQFKAQPVSVSQHDKLRALLSGDEIKVLVAVVEAKALAHELKALENMAEGARYPLKTDAAVTEAQQAHPYRNFLTVLKEIQSERSHSVLVTIVT